jgi:hypothetical protein
MSQPFNAFGDTDAQKRTLAALEHAGADCVVLVSADPSVPLDAAALRAEFPALARQQDVFRFQVTMNDEILMRIGNRFVGLVKGIAGNEHPVDL